MNTIRAFLARVRIRWHALIATLSIAFPVLLDQLQVIDFKPILLRWMSPEIAAVIIALVPFYIALLKPMIHLEDRKDCK